MLQSEVAAQVARNGLSGLQDVALARPCSGSAQQHGSETTHLHRARRGRVMRLARTDRSNHRIRGLHRERDIWAHLHTGARARGPAAGCACRMPKTAPDVPARPQLPPHHTSPMPKACSGVPARRISAATSAIASVGDGCGRHRHTPAMKNARVRVSCCITTGVPSARALLEAIHGEIAIDISPTIT